MGNWIRFILNASSVSDGMIGILGISTDSPLYLPDDILASMRLGYIAVIMHLVPLTTLGASRDLNTIIWGPNFKT